MSAAMSRAVVVMACCSALLIAPHTALADAASDQKMASHYEQAAQAGDDEAQFYLGALHSAGVGRTRSDAEAFRWFSRAADQGHAHSMLIVAGLYASGRGVIKDNVKAYSWAYIVASASKVDEDRNGARQLMSLLMKKMTSDEIGRAVVAARTWRAVRTAGAAKTSNIEGTAEQDQAAPPAPPPAPAVVQPAPPPAPAVVQTAPATPSSSTVSQAPSNVTVLPASPKAAAAPSVKNAKRDDARDLLDQVPSGLRKRFGF